MRHAVGLILLAACGGSPAPAKPTPPAPPVVQTAEAPPSDPRIAADLQAFDFLWQRVSDTFYDPKFGGVDWNAVKTELRPKILTTKSREDSRAIMSEALHRLGKSHFAVAGPLDDDAVVSTSEGDAGIGAELRVVGPGLFITQLATGSGAAAAKLPLGGEIVSIDGVAVAPKLADLATKLPASSLMPLYQIRALTAPLSGKPGTKVALVVAAGGKQATYNVERKPIGTPASFGNLGAQRVVYESRKLEPAVGYIRLSIFFDPPTVVPAFAKDVVGFGKTSGVIIDLRGNPGGIGGMAMGMAGYLVGDENKKLGTMKTRATALDFVINPQAQRYAGKVAILVDELSASTSEIFAGGLQDLGRAKVFGRRTPGAALPSVMEVLPNGDRLQYAIADYTSTSGKVLEGNGVTPDVPVTLDAQALRSGKDPDIVAATRWIKEK